MGQLLTFVFVDVEASTELMTRAGDERASAAIHGLLRAVRERIEPYGGREVKSLGDGLMLVFESPRSAVSFAVAVQQAVVGLRPRLRIGMNFGESTGSDGDPMGEAVNAASRITDKARGGEIVVSDMVRRLAGSMPGVRFVDRGRVAMKGFTERWHLHAVVAGSAAIEAMPVFGRDAELARLDALVTSVLAGSGGLVVLEGEAGIGKSHVARAAADRATMAGATVVTGRADELEQDRPGRILAAIADGLGLDFEALHMRSVPDLEAPVDPAFIVVERFIDAVEDAVAANPLVLVFEDLHWADDLSLRGIAGLARRFEPLPLGIVATMRPTPRPPMLHQVLGVCADVGAETLVLPGLDAASTTGIVASMTGAAPGPGLRARLGAAAGNPLFVTELLRALDEEGSLRVDGGVADTEEAGIPDGLVPILARRASGLPTETVEALRLASILGGEFTLDDLATVAGRSIVDVATIIRPAVDAALVSGEGSRLSFRHDLVREAVYLDIAPAIRTDLHAAAARALAGHDSPVQQIAGQYALGARPGDLIAVDWLVRAGRDAVRLDTGAAVTFYERALLLAPADWPRRAQVEATLVELLAWSGRIDDARVLATSLLDRSLTPSEEHVARRAFGAVLATIGELADAAGHLQAAAELPGLSVADRGILHCAAAGMSVIAGVTTPADAEATARPHLDTDERALACWAHHTMAIAAVASGAYDDQLRHATIARSLLDGGYVPPLGFLIPHTWVTTAVFNLDDLDDLPDAADAARGRAEERGDVSLLLSCIASTAGRVMLTGAWQEAAADATEGLALAEETGGHVQDVLFHAICAVAALARGDHEVADAHLVAGEADFAAGSKHAVGLDVVLWARCQLLELDGDPEAARAALELVWTQTENLHGLIQWRLLGPDLIRLSRSADDLGRAREIALQMEAIADRSTSVSATAAAARGRGLAEGDATQLVAALDLYRTTTRPTEAASTAEEAAVLLLEDGEDAHAAALLEEAAAIHRAAGADHHLARVDALLRRAGVRRRRSGVASATHGWESLSPKEREVATLVAEGLSNPQIGARLYISRRTVETHLSHVFRKLDLSNRTQLAKAVIEAQPSR